ncbi:hypothetical protein DTO282E5_5176 [Paecilomyces variotii]|nr:hypothetical protein DTO282E5_5176 [Paecilomyces variotii]
MESHFPNGCILSRYERKILCVPNHEYLIERVLSEKYVPEFVQRVAVFEAKKTDNQEKVILKLRFEMDPRPILESDRPTILEMAEDWFKEEVHCLESCQTENHATPILYGKEELVQADPSDLYPGGYLHAIAMSKVPGSPVTTFSKFSKKEINTIRQQLAGILEHMRQRGWYYDFPSKDHLFFERGSMHTSLVGFSGITPDDPDEIEPTTENSFAVRAFGLAGLPCGRR